MMNRDDNIAGPLITAYCRPVTSVHEVPLISGLRGANLRQGLMR